MAQDPSVDRASQETKAWNPATAGPRAHKAPEAISHYRIERELGRGGMGVVYLARDPRLDRPVAVKVLPDDLTSDVRRQRFEREARAAGRLNHPAIATVFEFGRADDMCFIAMEYVEGTDLQRLMLGRDPLPLERAIDIAIQIAEGLAAAHARKIVHRDLKPQNVMVSAGDRVKILDFGLAKVLETVTQTGETSANPFNQLTGDQGVLGTAGYMSPEQIRGEPVDARSDLFTFGILLYEMVTGEIPFRGESGADILSAILRDTPTPVVDRNPSLPAALDRIIARCLEKECSDRYESAAEIVADLCAVKDSSAEREVPSVAVLPFANLSADPDNEYFSDGIAEEIINFLSHIESLQVASRTSSFAFKDRHEDICRIGNQLRVRAVLEGSVRRAGKRLRITAQLVNTTDGYQLWSERFDRDLEDVFEIQDEIAQRIAEALEIVLTEEEKQAIEKVPTADVQAYDYYLRGRKAFHDFRRRADEEYAREMFRKAIEIDPEYALAYADLAKCTARLYQRYAASAENLHEADSASCEALRIDPDLAEGHVARGLVHSLMNQPYEAHVEFEKAIRLDPQLFDAFYFYGVTCHSQGDLAQAARFFQRACALQPENYYVRSLLAQCYAGMGRQDDSDAICRRGLAVIEKHFEVNPEDFRAICFGASALSQLGEREKALEWAHRAGAMEADDALVSYNIACTHALLGEVKEAINFLERAVEQGYKYREWIENDADLKALREDPKYKRLLERL